MKANHDRDGRKNKSYIEWISMIFGGGSILFVITYWILRASSYSYTDVIYLTADYEYGKYFGAAFDTVCGILPALFIGIPLLIKAFWSSLHKNNPLPQSLPDEAKSLDEIDTKIN
jgi:hypothetical protein